MIEPQNYHTKRMQISAIQYVGKNAADVRAWVNASPMVESFETWFITKSQSNPTEMQAWNYVKNGQKWHQDVVAAIYDYLHETWVGVKIGMYIVKGMKGEFYPVEEEVFNAKYEVDTES